MALPWALTLPIVMVCHENLRGIATKNAMRMSYNMVVPWEVLCDCHWTAIAVRGPFLPYNHSLPRYSLPL